MNQINKSLGVMQGRLLPKFKNKYQAHPIDTWKDEYKKAKELELNSIEFIFDYHMYSFNPLLKNPELIKSLQEDTGVQTKSICADFFMEAPIQEASKKELIFYGEIIERLIENLSKLGGTDIVIPFVDNSKIRSSEDEAIIKSFLDEFYLKCSKYSVNLSIETDLEPVRLAKLIESFNNNYVGINYDSGNSSSLGYNFSEEINLYGSKITDFHIKDRILHGKSVILGRGNADLHKVKDYLYGGTYNGLIIFQAYRDDEGFSIFEKQLNWFKNL